MSVTPETRAAGRACRDSHAVQSQNLADKSEHGDGRIEFYNTPKIRSGVTEIHSSPARAVA